VGSTRYNSGDMTRLRHQNFVWIDVPNPTEPEVRLLEKEFGFHQLDAEDVISPAQRPKLDSYPHYLFLILLFPIYDRASREILSSEIDIFIFPNALITFHQNNLTPIIELRRSCERDEVLRAKFLSDTPALLLYELLDRLLTYTYPMLDHVNLDIKNIERHIFSGYERAMVQEVLIIRRNIVNFRKIMQSHKTIIRKLLERSTPFFAADKLAIYFDNLIEHTKDIWETLDNDKETIEALQQTNEALISFRLNDILKLLTIISVILLPVNLIAQILSMNTPMPWIATPYSFTLALWFMALTGAGMTAWFKWKDWL